MELAILISIFVCTSIAVYIFSRKLLTKISEYREKTASTQLTGIWAIIFVRVLKPILNDIATYNQKIELPRYKTRLGKKLVSAGLSDELTPDEFIALKEILGIGGLIFYILFLTGWGGIPLALFLGLTGFGLPGLWLNDRTKKRHTAIFRVLPYYLDLITLSVEAGVDFSGAIGKVVEKGKRNPLNEEFSQMLREMKMGKTRRESLKDMVDRVNLPELTSFASALIQADQFGTGIGRILRIQAEQMRTKRWQKAEKAAMEAPLKMLFPLLIFIFPAVFIVIVIPIVLKLAQGGIF